MMVKLSPDAGVDPTTKYRLSLPFALHSVSASLSALHAARAFTHHPDTLLCLRSTHCPKCGTYLFCENGQKHLRIMRRKKKRRSAGETYPGQKKFRRTCPACLTVIDYEPSTPVNHWGISSVREVNALASNVSQRALPSEDQMVQQSGPSSRPVQSGSSAVPTMRPHFGHKTTRRKISTLQEMLAHERRKEESSKARKTAESHGRLSSFLQTL